MSADGTYTAFDTAPRRGDVVAMPRPRPSPPRQECSSAAVVAVTGTAGALDAVGAADVRRVASSAVSAVDAAMSAPQCAAAAVSTADTRTLKGDKRAHHVCVATCTETVSAAAHCDCVCTRAGDQPQLCGVRWAVGAACGCLVRHALLRVLRRGVSTTSH
jgi:hypothetical protein